MFFWFIYPKELCGLNLNMALFKLYTKKINKTDGFGLGFIDKILIFIYCSFLRFMFGVAVVLIIKNII